MVAICWSVSTVAQSILLLSGACEIVEDEALLVAKLSATVAATGEFVGE